MVDANALVHGDWELSGAAWRVAANETRHGRCRLVMPEVAVREVAARRSDAVASAMSNLRKTTEALRRLRVQRGPVQVEHGDDAGDYARFVREKVVDFGGVIPPTPAVDVLGPADKAVSRQPPFDESGSGFRDALVWAQVVDVLRSEADHRVVLISNDGEAFTEHGGSGISEVVL